MIASHYEQTFAQLEQLLAQWQEKGEMPKGVGVLSGGEWRALALAARHPVQDPLGDFFVLDDPLQDWVLKMLGYAHLYRR